MSWHTYPGEETMKHLATLAARGLAAMILTATIACGGADDTDSGADLANPLMNPNAPELNETAPDMYTAVFETSEGTFAIEVHREWAPNGADRFYNLVNNGYYDEARFFRVIDGFMAQFGMHADPLVNAQWTNKPIQDDQVTQSNTRGMVTFAARGQPNSRTTQVFVNFGDNSNLDEMGFAPFGEVVEGMEVVDALYGGYGEGAPRGSGPYQQNIAAAGNEYLNENFPELSYVISTSIR